MQSQAATVEAYLASLPEDRRRAISVLRRQILDHMDPALEEGMQYGMIGYYVPHSRYPQGYHCDPAQPLPFAALASQKNHLSVYVMGLYDPTMERWLKSEFKAAGKRLDMGKCCLRFRKLDDAPLDVLGELFRRLRVADYIAYYEATLAKTSSKRRPAPASRGAAADQAGKKATKKATKKKATKKKVAPGRRKKA